MRVMKTIHVRSEESGDYTRLTWTDPFSGERKRVSIGRTADLGRRGVKDAVTRKAQELNNDPALAAMGRMSLGRWRERFVATADLAESSLTDVGWTFDRLVEFFGAGEVLPAIDAGRARDFVLWLETREYRGRKPSVATVRKHVRNCKTICERAVVERAKTGLAANPFELEKSSVPTVAKDWATVDDDAMGKILAACPSAAWRCMFGLARYAGLRQQEAYRLEWGQVHWDDPVRLQVLVPDDEAGNAADEDTKNKYRVVPIESRLYPLLREAFESGDAEGPCRSLPADNKVISGQAAKIIVRAGVPYAKPLHTLRKNRQTEWTKQIGKDQTCALMGNSSDVADRHYIAPPTLADLRTLSVQIAPKSAPK